MDSLQRIYKLHQIISSRRHPVSCQVLQDELECSRATIKRKKSCRDMSPHSQNPTKP